MVWLFLLILWPIAEVFVAIKVADAIGVLLTVVLLLAGWPLGSWLLRSRGRAAWRRLAAAVQAGRTPGREVLDGVLVLFGGMLLMIPGFITDAIGLLLLLTPVRALTRGLLIRNLQSRLVTRAVSFTRRDYDVDSSATDADQPRLTR